jgi:hypothetical protein
LEVDKSMLQLLQMDFAYRCAEWQVMGLLGHSVAPFPYV